MKELWLIEDNILKIILNGHVYLTIPLEKVNVKNVPTKSLDQLMKVLIDKEFYEQAVLVREEIKLRNNEQITTGI